jgi:hypothetical protein
VSTQGQSDTRTLSSSERIKDMVDCSVRDSWAFCLCSGMGCCEGRVVEGAEGRGVSDPMTVIVEFSRIP